MYTIDFISRILGITDSKLPQKNQTISEIGYDSRKISNASETLFFALKALRDGHDFIADAYEKGVRNFVISREIPFLNSITDANIFYVRDVLESLQRLANYHRKQFKYPIIGITGSNGKSIVKEWLYQMLSIDNKVFQSPKSYNSQLGVALSLWNLNSQYDLAIIEAGVSEPGEMDRLQYMIQPTVGILTNIGIAHAQNFESKQQKLEEKAKLFQDTLALIAGSEYISDLNLSKNTKVVTWGKQEGDSIQLISEEIGTNHSVLNLYIAGKNVNWTIPFTDKASIENVLTCITVLYFLEYPLETIGERIQFLRPLEMRLQMKKGINHSSIIDDSYSNDLASLQISLDFLQQQNQHAKKSLILSDIEGLDNNSKFQNKLINLLNAQSLDRIIWIGPRYDWLNQIDIEDLTFYDNTTDLILELSKLNFHNESILIKGARKFQFEHIVQKLSLRTHGTVMEINLNAITNNLKVYRSMIAPNVKLMTMVKAFSYGSGSFEVANLLQFSKVDYLTVAFVDEGVELRSAGIKLPIMVLSPDSDTFQSLIEFQLEPEVYSMRFLKEFKEFLIKNKQKNIKVHIKLDTGMHRLGFFPDEMDAIVEELKNQDLIKVQSCFTHLVASGDPLQDEFTKEQIRIYKEAVRKLEVGLGYSIIKHAANTSGIVRWPEAHFDMVRLGIGLYGVDMDRKLNNLEQVSTLKTTITQLKELEAGETVGYDRAGVLTRQSKIATVKIGYADGYNRRFGLGIGKMQINGQLVPTVGKICMDMTMLDVTNIDVKEGDEVLVFPDLHQASKDIGTIPYELLVNISSRVKRVYYFE